MKTLFDEVPPGTIGLEEEVLLLDPGTFLPAPIGPQLAERVAEVTEELPAAQVELVTRPHATAAEALAELAAGRAALAAACAGAALPAAAALHPTARGAMAVNPGPRYQLSDRLHRWALRRQLIGALQIHIAVGGADRTLAVYNALRGLLPELGALAAAAPFFEGEDTGLASARPIVSGLLPRQGIPPAISSWDAFAAELAWGARTGGLGSPSRWWYELRPHLTHGTLEIRVPDVQPSLAGAAVVVDACVTIVRGLSERFDAGEPLPVHPSWRISENRWTALADGLDASLADLVTGAPMPVRDRLAALGVTVPERTAAEALREVGVDGAAAWLASVFL